MHGYLTHELNQARQDDMHRRAAEVRRARRSAPVGPRREARHTLLTTLREALG
jgi:hypothetical protein